MMTVTGHVSSYTRCLFKKEKKNEWNDLKRTNAITSCSTSVLVNDALYYVYVWERECIDTETRCYYMVYFTTCSYRTYKLHYSVTAVDKTNRSISV